MTLKILSCTALTAFAALAFSAPAAAQNNGDLIAADPMANAPSGMQAWRIRYLTRNDRGALYEVTGVVVAPRDGMPREPRRVIAWTHGTWGTAEKCAPSLSSSFYDMTPALDAVRRGYVVVAPDFPGLGSPGPHPYLVGTVTGRSVLDSIRAARAIGRAAAGTDYVVWGESQGGHAALWTGQLARTDGEGLRLLGVAAAVPVTDIAANLRQASDANARAFLTALATDSWSRYYGVPLRIGRARTPGIIRKLAGNCVSGGGAPKIGGLLGVLALRQDLRNVDLGRTQPWANFGLANNPTPISQVPVLIAQDVADPLSPLR